MLDKIKWFWRYYRNYPGVLAILLILTPIQVALQVTIPRLIGSTINVLETGKAESFWLTDWLGNLAGRFNIDVIFSYGIGFIILGFVSHVLYAYFQSWRAWMNLKLEWLFRQRTFDNITSKGPDFFNKFRSGDLITRMTDDVAEKLSWFACSGIFRLYEATLGVVFIVIMMTTIDPILTLWTAGPLPLLIVIFFISSSLLDKRYDQLQKRISDFNDIMESCFSGIRVVKAYVREKAQMKKFNESARERRKAEISAVKVTSFIDSLYHYIWQFGVVIVLVAGGYRVLYSGLSLGQLATFIYYVTWLVFPMFDIGQFLVKSRQSAVSINRLLELENVPPMVEDNGAHSNGELKGSIKYDQVMFKFPDSERSIIDNISFEIKAGQTVAFVGRVGSGKSWLVNMLPRLVDPTGGTIKLDDRELQQFSLSDLRRNIGYVPQEPVLFSDTIKNNIVFGRESISDSLIEWAIEVSQFSEDLKSFPKGLDTPIGTRGMAISGGQKQRLALARALVGKPKVLILDDCTSALDSKTEAALWGRLHEVMPEMTAILITHRPDTLERADNIFVMDNGKIAETGTHSVLISKESLYAKIYRRFQLEQAVTG
ncbi:MAG: ABC transporter ATP-binding protein [bacterium]